MGDFCCSAACSADLKVGDAERNSNPRLCAIAEGEFQYQLLPTPADYRGYFQIVACADVDVGATGKR